MFVTKEEYLKAYHEILAKCNSGELMKMSVDDRYSTLDKFHKTWHEYADVIDKANMEYSAAGAEFEIGFIIVHARHYMEVDDDGYYYPLNVIYTHPEKIYDGSFKQVKYVNTGIHSL
ncbi:MAG: hypothetical protein IKP67_02895 [Spirochaetales bacterium]|nr:hypothetical protein [Spirochaetales bacterium]